jgi:putative MFS transporter
MASPFQESTRALPSLAEIVEKVGFGWTHLRFILTGGGVWFADGSELLLISAVTSSVAAEWNLNSLQRGSMVTYVYIGVFFGNLVSGPLADRNGRRQLILASYIGIFAFSMVSSFMESFESLCIWRFFVGFSFGIGQPPWNVLAAEVTPAKWRVVVNGFSQSLFALGEVYSSLLILMEDPTMNNLNWRLLLRLGAVPALLFWIAGSFFLLRSPYYLAQSGRHDEAVEVLTIMQRDNCLPTFCVNFADPPRDESEDEACTDSVQRIGKGPLFATTAIMCYTCFVVNLIYYGCLYAFPNLLPVLTKTTVSSSSAAIQLLVGAVWEVPGIALACFFGMCMPRKLTLKIYCFISLLSLLLFVNGATGEVKGFLHALAWHVGYYAIKCIVQLGWIISYIYVAEVYPTRVRTTGCSFNIAAGRIGSTISPLVYEKMKDATGSHAGFFYMLTGFIFINLVLIDFLPIETYNAPLADTIDDNTKSVDYGATEAGVVHNAS